MKAFVMLAALCGVAVAQSSTQTFDVRSYASLQEALSAASAAGGGTVQPQPNTTYTGPITLPANVTLRCADRSTVLTIPNAKNGAVLSIGGSNTAIINCTLDGNAANQKGGSGAIVNSADASNVLIDNAEIRNTYGAGVFLGATSAALGNVRVTNSYIHDTGLMGIHVGGSHGLRIQHNRIKAFAVRTTKNDGLELTPSGSRTIFNTDVVISGNEIINTVSTFFGIESASGTYSQVVDGCSISDNVWDGGGLPASGISGFFFNCSMTGNTHVRGTGTHRSGYEIVGTGDTISNNKIDNGSIAIAGGIGGPTSHMVVSGNQIVDNAASGDGGISIGGQTRLSPISDVTVTGNEVNMTNERPAPGIFLGVYGLAQQLNRIKISGNKIYCSKAKGAAGSGIRFHALTGSSDIEVGMNTVAGCRTGWQDDDVAGDYENVTVHNNDLHDNAKPIEHNYKGGGVKVLTNITGPGR